MTAMQNIVSVRASSFGSLFDCAYKWEGQHILGMKMPSSPRAHLGTAIHSGTAIYDLAMLEKIEGFTAKDAAESMLHELRNPEYEVNWAAETDLTLKKAEIIGQASDEFINANTGNAEYKTFTLEEIQSVQAEVIQKDDFLKLKANQVRNALSIGDLESIEQELEGV